AVVIGAEHLPTPARVLVDGGHAHVPPPRPSRKDPYVGFTYVPGDGVLASTSLTALPGVDRSRVWFVTPSKHGALPSHPEVHRLALEAMLGRRRAIPKTNLHKLAVSRPAREADPRVPSPTPCPPSRSARPSRRRPTKCDGCTRATSTRRTSRRSACSATA